MRTGFKSRAAALARAILPPAATRGPRLLDTHDFAVMDRDEMEDACRRLASPVYLGGGVALCRILGRYKFHVSTSDEGFGANVLLDGYWESWLTRFMARTVRPGATVVDVGANYGYYSVLLADLVGPEGRVYAVEPNPDAASLLTRSLALNGFSARATVEELALGSGDEAQAVLFVPEGEPKNAALIAGEEMAQSGGRRVKVRVRSLDSLLGSDVPIDFIKIDAEGGEEAIIEGMERILATRPPPMVLEYNAARYADPERFLQRLLRSYGSLRHVDHDGRAVAISPERVLTEHFGEDWLLFLSRS
jgi:FkbM family methyltransferase